MSTHQVGTTEGDTDDNEDLNKDECIVDENVSPIEVDEWDTVALNKYCNKS